MMNFISKRFNSYKFNFNEKENIKLHLFEKADLMIDAHDFSLNVNLHNGTHKQTISCIDFIGLLSDEAFKIQQCCADVKLLWYYFGFVKKIISQNAIIPQLYELNQKYYALWNPLAQNDYVQLQLTVLNKCSKAFLCTMSDEK